MMTCKPNNSYLLVGFFFSISADFEDELEQEKGAVNSSLLVALIKKESDVDYRVEDSRVIFYLG